MSARPQTNSTTYVPTDGSLGMVKFLKDSYSDISAIYFEAVIGVTFGGIPNGSHTGYARLYNHTDSTDVSGSEVFRSIPAGSDIVRLRSGDIKAELANNDVLYPQFRISNFISG